MNQGLHLNEKRGVLLDSKSHFQTQNKAFPNYGNILMRKLHLEKYGNRQEIDNAKNSALVQFGLIGRWEAVNKRSIMRVSAHSALAARKG